MNPAEDEGGLEPAPRQVAEVSGVGAHRVGERLQARVVVLWWLTGIARAALMSIAIVYGVDALRTEAGLPSWTPDAASALSAFLVATAVLAPPWTYATFRFAADDRLLSMRYGMLFVEDRRIPVPRMQHVDITRGPVERLFGLSTLVVFTAGNEGSAFRVPGLSKARAEALRDGILRARGRDVV